MKEQLDDLYLLIISLSGTMPLELQPALKKQKTTRVFTTDQKGWLIELRENNPPFKHARLAEELKDKYGGDVLRSSTVSDWLKPAATRKVLEQSNKDSVSSKKKLGSCRSRDPKCHRLCGYGRAQQ